MWRRFWNNGILLSLLSLSALALPGRVWAADNFRVAVYSLPEKLDPSRMLDVSTALIFRQVFAYLYNFDGKNDLRPELADSHLVLNDGLTYRIKLKPGFKFSDGSEVKAKDVVHTLNRVLEHHGGQLEWAFRMIKGYQASLKSRGAGFKDLAGVRAINDHEVEIDLQSRSRDFLQILASSYFGIVKAGTGVNDEPLISDQYKVEREGKLSLTLVPTAANTGSNIQLQFIKVASPAEAIQSAIARHLDFIFPANSTIKVKGRTFLGHDSLNSVILQVNTERKIFANATERCAFTQSLSAAVEDLPNISKKLKLGLPFSTAQAGPPAASAGATTAVKATAKTKQKNLKVKIKFIDSVAVFTPGDLAKIRQVLKSKGFDVEFDKMPLRKFLPQAKFGQFDAVLWGYGLDYFSPDALISPVLVSGQQYNFANYVNPELDQKVAAARQAQTDPDRSKLYDEVFAIVSKECPLTFLGLERDGFLLDNKFSLEPPSSLGVHTLVFARQLRIK